MSIAQEVKARIAIRDAKERHGAAWGQMTADQQKGAVALQILDSLSDQIFPAGSSMDRLLESATFAFEMITKERQG